MPFQPQRPWLAMSNLAFRSAQAFQLVARKKWGRAGRIDRQARSFHAGPQNGKIWELGMNVNLRRTSDENCGPQGPTTISSGGVSTKLEIIIPFRYWALGKHTKAQYKSAEFQLTSCRMRISVVAWMFTALSFLAVLCAREIAGSG